MFGLLRPSGRGLRCGERQEFNRFYCGLCKGLDHHHGLLTRGLLSYDGVFVALLVDALVDEVEVAAPSKCRCPMLPLVHRPTVAPDSVAMTYAASVQMLLFNQWAADGGRSLVRRFSRPHAELAHARLDALGVSLRSLEDFERVQADVESSAATPDEAAAPTASALRLVFASIAQLGPRAAAETLGQLGVAIGRAIYFVDALEDLDDDLRKGAFNPCILQGQRSPKRVRETARLLRADVDALPALLDALPIARHERVLRDIAGELRARSLRAIEGVRRVPESRFRALVVAMGVFLWALLCSVPRAWAAGKKHAGKHPSTSIADAGIDAGPDASIPGLPEIPPLVAAPDEDASTPPPESAPKSSKAKPADAGKSDDEKGGAGCPKCGDCGKACDDCCKAPGRCCDSCTGCCDACKHCGDTCDGCTKCCDSCGNCCK